MINKIKLISILCLALCLILSACGDAEHKDDKTPNDSIIYAPDIEDGTKPSDTKDDTDAPDTADTDAPDESIAPDDTTADTVVTPDSADDTEPSIPDTDEVTEPIEPDDTTAPDDNTSTEVIDLRGQLSVDYPISGKFVSKESEKILLVVNYECVMQISGDVKIEFEVGLETYDINCGERVNGGKFSVNGEAYTFSTERIVREESGKVYIPFAAYTYISENGEKSCKVDASWFFNGNYAGDKIDYLTANAELIWD